MNRKKPQFDWKSHRYVIRRRKKLRMCKVQRLLSIHIISWKGEIVTKFFERERNDSTCCHIFGTSRLTELNNEGPLPARVTKLAFVRENRVSAPNSRQLAILINSRRRQKSCYNGYTGRRLTRLEYVVSAVCPSSHTRRHICARDELRSRGVEDKVHSANAQAPLIKEPAATLSILRE